MSRNINNTDIRYTNKGSIKKIIFAVLGFLCLFIFSILPETEIITHPALLCLGCFFWAVMFWVGDVLPFYLTCLGLIAILVLTGTADFSVAAAGFSNNIVFFMGSSMGLSVALQKSGLLRRIGYNVLKFFPSNPMGQALGMLAVCYVINPIIPSVIVKLAAMIPLCKEISDSLGYEPYSKGSYGLWTASFIGLTLGCLNFYNGSFTVVAMRGVLSEDVYMHFDFFRWFLASLPWTIICLFLLFILLNIIYKPEKNSVSGSKEYIRDAAKALGPMSSREKISTVIISICVLLWVFETYTGIPSYIVSIVGMILMIVTGVISSKECVSGISWEMLITIATFLSLGGVFTGAGVDQFLSSIVVPVLENTSSNKLIFLLAISCMTYVVRFIITSQFATIPIMGTIALPLAPMIGISEWTIAFVILTGMSTWSLLYQSSFAIQAYSTFGGEKYLHYKDLSKVAWCYWIVNPLAIMFSYPFWSLLGLV